ncbi:MAG: Dna2/Cas4 domain-containing protein, partial [Prevotellaceae bacterium]|nr:Dna2/Cas4 domain-containing protein [Prevotellaceae bacterium]
KKISDNVFNKPVVQQDVDFNSFGVGVTFRQSNKSRDFIESDADEEANEQKTYIKMGNILHNLFSKIRTTDDIPGIIRQLEFDGVLYDNDITADKMRDTLEKRLSDKRVADWFNPRWQLFNECSILYVDKETNNVVERRPDRVITDGKEMIVIDFKFGKPREEYKTQVRQYMQLLDSMGYKNIKGYLWFVYSNKIEEVNM